MHASVVAIIILASGAHTVVSTGFANEFPVPFTTGTIV